MNTQMPVEVELIYEVMPCNAMRVSQEPLESPHPCGYFRKWGTYHSYDYPWDFSPFGPAVKKEPEYIGRAFMVPEVLSGCRKAPILALGINPNLPGFWPGKMNSIAPLFDNYQQYAHYFRYRSTDKLEIPGKDYEQYGGAPTDNPFTTLLLKVPADPSGEQVLATAPQHQAMYLAYQDLLFSVAKVMHWKGHHLSVGEDLSYGNMVACASAKWTTAKDTANPSLPPMSTKEVKGIVQECFFKRKYFLRQLLQSLPKVILIFSQTTAGAFISTFKGSFTQGDPQVNDTLEKLIDKKVVLGLGTLPGGLTASARVIFSPHATGNPKEFQKAKQKVIAQLVEEARAGNLSFNAASGHLHRTVGSCAFCPILKIGNCDYEQEITSPVDGAKVFPELSLQRMSKDQSLHTSMMAEMEKLNFHPKDWEGKE
ncbi:hypothetical protein ACX0G9_24745 [Flavitalea flava]